MLRITARDSRRARTSPCKIALQQRHAGALDGDVGARAHGDADVGGGQRRRVVDPVAGHGDRRGPRPAASAPPCALSSGQDLGLHLVDAQPPATARAVVAVVAGHHDQAHAVGLQRAHRLGRGRLHRVGDAEEARERGRRPSRRSRSSPSARSASASASSGARIDALLGHQPRAAEGDLSAVDRSRHALADRRVEARRLPTSASSRSLAARRMASASGCSLPRSRLAARRSSSASSTPGHRRDRGHRRAALGQRAGLVDAPGCRPSRSAPAPRRS